MAEAPTADAERGQPLAQDPLARLIADTYRKARAEGLSVDVTAQVLAQVMRRKFDQEVAEDVVAGDVIWMQSIVSGHSGTPYVQCRIGETRWQWEIEAARQHALAVLSVAEAAVHDAATYRWLTLRTDGIGMETSAAMIAVRDLRRFRGDVEREDWVRAPEGAESAEGAEGAGEPT